MSTNDLANCFEYIQSLASVLNSRSLASKEGKLPTYTQIISKDFTYYPDLMLSFV